MRGEKVALIINSPSYDRVAYALTVAGMWAALGKEVYVLFTYGAINRLVKGRTDEVGEETDRWIRRAVKEGLEKGRMQKISDMLRNLKKFGGSIHACIAAMAFHSVTKEELIEEVDRVTGVAAFLELTEGASIMLYI